MSRQIGFHATDHGVESPEPTQSWELVVWPEPNADLTLQERHALLSTGLGRPVLSIVWGGTIEPAVDDLILRHSYRSFANLRRDDTLKFLRGGALAREQQCEIDGSRPGWFDVDHWIPSVTESAVRAINVLSFLPSVRSVHLGVSVCGLEGSCAIFNPHHETFRTRWRGTGPVGRHEVVELAAREEVEESLVEALFNGLNEVMNRFQAEGYTKFPANIPPFECITREEVGEHLGKALAKLEFSGGIFARPN